MAFGSSSTTRCCGRKPSALTPNSASVRRTTSTSASALGSSGNGRLPGTSGTAENSVRRERDLAAQRLVALFRVLPEERVGLRRRGRFHARPVVGAKRLRGARHDQLLLLRDVVAVVDEIGRGGDLDFGARDERVAEARLEVRAQLLAGARDDAVLLLQAREHRLEIRAALREDRERHVLARVV